MNHECSFFLCLRYRQHPFILTLKPKSMNRILVFFVLLLFATMVSAQEGRSKRVVIGIGNPETEMYDRTIEVLSGMKEISGIKKCESHQILAFDLNTSLYKDEMELIKFLSSEIEGLRVYLKDESILKNECYGEIIKQQ